MYTYALETGNRVPCPFGQFNAVFVGKTSFVYTRPGQPADKNQYLYDVLSNRIVRLKSLLSEEARVAFYAPPNGPDATLVSLTAKCLNLVDLRASAQRGRFVYQSIPANGTLFVPTSLRVEGSLIKVRRQDGLFFSFLPTIYYNRRSYLNEHIYPQLTNDDERKLGLIN